MNKFTNSFIRHLSWIGFLFIFMNNAAQSQTVDISSCGSVDRRNNGNGQYALSAGIFPGYGLNNPVASNVVGTPYQIVPFDPATKTGSYSFSWSSPTPITNIPVITRVWITPVGETTAILCPTKFGPPSPPEIIGSYYKVSYSYYLQNMPPSGEVSFEFTDPQTNQPAFTCTFDLQQNIPSDPPIINCAPTITAQPTSLNVCDVNTATFSVAGDGINSIQWQVSPDGINNWTAINNGGDYSGATSTTLTISNPATYNGQYYRAMLTGDTGCGTTLSTVVLLKAKNEPTAVFVNTSLCGTGSQSLAVNLTGSAPWNLSYSTTPSGGSTTFTTISNITSSPYYFSINPSVSTTYTITSVSDAYCSNGTPTGNVTALVSILPTVTPSNVSTCFGASSFNLAYSSTGSPDQYSLIAGVRVMPDFTTITNAVLTASPVTVSIPANVPAGVYDFILTVNNSATGCASASIPFTVTVYAQPIVTATATSETVCSGASLTLNAAPSNLSSFAWSSNPASSIASVYNPPVTLIGNTTYTVTGTDAHGCSASSTVNVTASQGPTLSLTPASPTICNGNAVTITASGGNTYSWSPATGLSATAGDIVVASPSTTTTYTITSQNLTGCQSIGTVTVSVTTPTITVTPSETICSGSIKTLTASGGSTYAWYPVTGLYTNAAATTPYAGTSLSTVYAKPAVSTTYYIVGTTASECQGLASTTVTISAAPINTSTSTVNNLVFCAQGTTAFDLIVNITTSVTSMSWAYSLNGSSFSNITAPFVTSPNGIKYTPTITSNSASLNITEYGSNGYTGERYFRLTIVGASCTYYYDIFITDTKGTDPTPAPTATQTTICSGNSVTLTIGNLASGSSAQWQSSANNIDWSNIAGATLGSYTVAPVANTYYRVVFNTGVGNCGSTSSATLITVVTGMDPNTVSPATTCTDGSSMITLTGSSITSGTYQWQMSTTSSSAGFTDVLGATSLHYTLPTNIVPATRWYTRIANTSTCSSSNSASVAVYAPISNNQITNSPLSFCGPASATTLIGTTPTGGNGTYIYQWMFSTNGISFSNVASGGTSRDYTTSAQTQSYWYKRVVTSGGCSDESSIFKITVNAIPVVAASANSGICSGNTVTLTASGATNYTWSPATELSATTGSSVMATPTATRTYTVTGTDGNGCTNMANTTITVTALPSNPTLSGASQTICSGSVDLTAVVNSGGTTTWYTAPEANASYVVSNPTTVSAAGIYYVFATNGTCYSAGYATFTLTVANVSAPVLNATSLSYCAPATADLIALQPSVSAGTTVEWHTVSSNPTPSNLVSTPSAVGTGTYYLYAYATAGSCFGSSSAAVSVTINALTAASVSSTTISACEPATINLESYNNTPGPNTYSWYTSSTPDPAFLVTFPTQISQSGTYYLFATNASGCPGPASSGVTVTLNEQPSVAINSPDAFCGTIERTISASSTGSGLSYQWQVSANSGSNWSDLGEGNPYAGVTSQNLSIITSAGLSGNYYRCLVSSPAGCSNTSSAAILVGESVPALVENPADTIVFEGALAFFNSSVDNSPTYSYEWLVSSDGGTSFDPISDNTTYSGFNSSTLVIPTSTMDLDSGLYRVAVVNACGTLYSCAALLKIEINTLPVTWLDFSARKLGHKVILNWSTATETNTDCYVIQHSDNCTSWREIGNVKASGNSVSTLEYDFEHNNPENGINYYRLLQRDHGGKTVMSDLVWVSFDTDEGPVSIFPNPVVNGQMNMVLQAGALVSLYSSHGALIFSRSLEQGAHTIDVTNLSMGLYYLSAEGQNLPVMIR